MFLHRTRFIMLSTLFQDLTAIHQINDFHFLTTTISTITCPPAVINTLSLEMTPILSIFKHPVTSVGFTSKKKLKVWVCEGLSGAEEMNYSKRWLNIHMLGTMSFYELSQVRPKITVIKYCYCEMWRNVLLIHPRTCKLNSLKEQFGQKWNFFENVLWKCTEII